MQILASLTLILVAALNAESARILGIFHSQSRSHHILGSALLKALAAKGHQVTMISPFPLKPPVKNYEDIELTGILEFAEENMQGLVNMQKMPFLQFVSKMKTNVRTINEMVINQTAVQGLLNSGRKFDLVILNWFFNDAHLGIANHLKAPVIAFSTFGASTSTNRITGNPSPYAYVPLRFTSYSSDMRFFQRVGNTLMNILFEILEYFDNEPSQQLLHKYFPEAPSLQELHNNISLFLLNSHFSLENPRPYVPNMVQVGGLQVEQAAELSGELKAFMDSATQGVLFFSLGTNLKMRELSKEKLEAIASCFGKLPLKVLWKFESGDKLKLPPNVKVGKWFPQSAILAHSNTKAFLTHGGLLSTTEAIYHGVPLVGMPFFADQHSNVADGVNNGYAVKLSYNDLTEQSLTHAINEILTNPKYRENIKIRSLALRDQPLKPMDNAIYWIEYVLRYKGAPHLKASAVKLRWWQYFLVDVFAFLFAVLFISLYVIKLIFKTLLKLARKLIFKPPNKSKVE